LKTDPYYSYNIPLKKKELYVSYSESEAIHVEVTDSKQGPSCLKIVPDIICLEQDQVDKSVDMPGICPSVPAIITGQLRPII